MVQRMVASSLFIGAMLLSFFSGSGDLKTVRSERAPPFSLLLDNIAPREEHPLTEHKAFAVVVIAHNASSWCEKALRSLFEQDHDYFRVLFVDDASMDDSLDKAQQFIVDNHLEDRVIAVRNETRVGFTASLYRAIQECLDKEIVVPIDASNWLSFEGALSRLNRVFQNPDVWIAYSSSVSYPGYMVEKAIRLDEKEIRRKGYPLQKPLPFLAFYAGLFKSIPLPNLFAHGAFIEDPLAWQIPLLEMSGGRLRSLKEPLLVENGAAMRRRRQKKEAVERHTFFEPLAAFPLSTHMCEGGVDVVLFSYDRPLQLYAELESIRRHLKGIANCTLLYRSSDTRFDAAYQEVFAAFPEIKAVKQSGRAHKDFKLLLEGILSHSTSEYILFCSDDLVMKDNVDLTFCQNILERTGAYAFYLRFGCNIQHSYMAAKPLARPQSVELGNGVFAWDVRDGREDWALANNFEMSLYRREELRAQLEGISYKNPQSLMEKWTSRLPEKAVGLYFEQSKMVNLPLNSVQSSGKPNMNYMTAEELLLKFNHGLKIDIKPLFHVNNPAPHYEWAPELIVR